jgi:hypothetical protein
VINFREDSTTLTFTAYTSLLRITTSPPPTTDEDKEAPASTSAPESSASQPTPEARSGIFGTSLLRGLSFNRNHPLDVESHAGTARVGA